MNSHSSASARFTSLHSAARRLSLLALLCAALPAGAVDYLWYGSDDLLGGNNTWNTTNTYWITGGARAVWPNANADTARAVFGGTQNAPFTVTIPAATTINANALWFQNTYTLAAGDAGSTLNFVGTAPTIQIDAGLTTTTNVAMTGTSVTLTGGGTWALGTANRLGDSLGLIVDGGSTFNIGGNAETVGKVTLIAGTLAGTAALTTTDSFNLLSGSASVVLAGNGRALNKYGTGTATLNAANTYTGATNVSEGTLQLGAAQRIDDTSALNVGGGTFAIGAYNETVGTVTLTSGSITGTTGVLTGSAYNLESGTVGAILGGTAALTKTTGGTAILNGVNTYTGATNVNGGTLQLGGANRIANGSALTVNGGTFNLGTYNETVGAVTLVAGSIAGTGTATLTGSSYALQSGTVSARLGGNVALTKSTAGTVTLSGANTYTGATTINGGSLVLTGSLSSRTQVGSTVTVNSGGTLAGTGNAARLITLNAGGTLSPGIAGVGTLSTRAETWAGGGAYDWNISSPTGVAGTNWDLLAITGNLTSNATSVAGNRFILNVLGSGALPSTTAGNTVSWQIATYTGSFQGGFSPDEFTINLGGNWAGLNSNYLFSVTQGADSHSLYLTMAVPEPKDYAMILGAITLGLVGYRRWRRPARLA